MKFNPDEIWKYITADFSHLSKEEKIEKTSNVRFIASYTAAGLAIMPIPFADIFLLTPIQGLMVRAVGNIYGYKINREVAAEIATVIGGGWLGQQTILALYKIGLPGAGGFIGSAFVFSWTYGMGKAAELYFASGMTASKQELRKVAKEGSKEGKVVYEEREKETKKKITEMQNMNFTQEQIIYAVWNKKIGEEGYEEAQAEYNRVIKL